MTTRKVSCGTQRAMLLKKFMDMKLSKATQSKIAHLFTICGKNTEKREQKAKEILEVMETCRTEEEVIEKLGLTSR